MIVGCVDNKMRDEYVIYINMNPWKKRNEKLLNTYIQVKRGRDYAFTRIVKIIKMYKSTVCGK